MSAKFVHLKVHTEYSLTNGLVRIKPLIAKVLENQMPAVAITDQSNLCALVKFYKATRGGGIKPIIGVDISTARWRHQTDNRRGYLAGKRG